MAGSLSWPRHPEETEMKTMRLVLPLLLVGFFGCDVEGPVNSKDFGPQPWPGPCEIAFFSNGEANGKTTFLWENGLLERMIFNTGDYWEYSYREDGRIDEVGKFNNGNSLSDTVKYEWNENGQLSGKTGFSPNSISAKYNRSEYMYGTNDELIMKIYGEWDPESETIQELLDKTDYFYDDLGRMIRKEETRPQTSPDPNYIVHFFYQDDETGYYRMDWERPTGTAYGILEYDENGNWVRLDVNDGRWWKLDYDENGNLLKTEFLQSEGGLMEYRYSYDCWL
jgi:YD repeat-containing protein